MILKNRIFVVFAVITIVCSVSIAFALSNFNESETNDTFAQTPQETTVVIESAVNSETIASEQPVVVKEPTPTPKPTQAPKVEPIAETSAPTETPDPTDNPAAPKTENPSSSAKAREWGHLVSNNHATPWVSDLAKKYASEYGAYYVYNTDEKVIYLTFDAGYENGNTGKILDVLKKHDVKATFFICTGFANQNPEGLKRMVNEGHLVGNHTENHIPLYNLSAEQIASELKEVEDAYKRVTGQEMLKYMRPPEGGYSEESLKITQNLGYKTIMWSLDVPNDWNMKDQPSKETALSVARNQHHKGAIPILHAVSPTIANSLDEILTIWENEGYRFGQLTEIQ